MPPPSAADLGTLNKVSDTVVELIDSIVKLLEEESPFDPQNSKIPSTALAHDAADLVKAHSTKISLLIINKPFTPTAITKVLRELLEAAIPSLASAASSCHSDRYTAAFSQELRFRCKRVLETHRELVTLIPRDGKILPDSKKNGTSDGRGSIATTSLVWSCCEDVKNLHKLGVGGLLSEKLEQRKSTIDDIKEELKEWKEENENPDSDDDEDGDEHDGDNDDAFLDDQDELDNLMSAQKIPKDRTDIRNQLKPCITRLGLLSLFYKAIIKQRIKVLPDLPTSEPKDVVARLNDVYPILHGLPDDFDELIAAFYKLDAPLIETTRAQCFRQACDAAEMLRRPWVGEKDGFTDWIGMFEDVMNTPPDSETNVKA